MKVINVFTCQLLAPFPLKLLPLNVSGQIACYCVNTWLWWMCVAFVEIRGVVGDHCDCFSSWQGRASVHAASSSDYFREPMTRLSTIFSTDVSQGYSPWFPIHFVAIQLHSASQAIGMKKSEIISFRIFHSKSRSLLIF